MSEQIVSRILFRLPVARGAAMIIPLRTAVAGRLKRHNPRTWGRAAPFSYLVLLRMGFTKLSRSPGKLVSSYLAFSPLPALAGGLLSVALSFPSPGLGVTQHPVLRSPDFPPPCRSRQGSGRPSYSDTPESGISSSFLSLPSSPQYMILLQLGHSISFSPLISSLNR